MAKRHSNRIGDLESLFLRLEELVLANSGEDEFEEVFKILIAKLIDERSGGEPRFRTYQGESETFRAIGSLLREAEKAWPGILETSVDSKLTPEHLEVCVEALQQHRLSDAGFEVMDGLFEFLVAKGSKGAKGQYFTPRHVVELCVRLLKPTAQDVILDPACGSGGFLVHALNYVREHESLATEALQDYCAAKIWGFDIDPQAVRVAKALMVLAGDGKANIVRLNGLLQPDMLNLFGEIGENGATGLTIEDVCRSRMRNHKGFDIILTNPPFAGEVREKQILEGYSLSKGKARIERDILFLERCVQLLKPGGRMAIVLPHNKFAVDSFGYVREWTLKRTQVLGVIGLGHHTFLPHTHQKASVLLVRKNLQDGRNYHNPRIFFAISERDGKNSKGQFITRRDAGEGEPAWNRVDHDFDEIVSSFGEFTVTESLTEH
jgi:type I restriction enzyme M protein